jgi:predicted small secreted protein
MRATFPLDVSTPMNGLSLASAAAMVLLSSALVTGCATTKPAGRCDTAQSVGSCTVKVETHGSKLVVCPAANATPVCMNATVNVKRPGRAAQPMQVFLEPNQCVPLSAEVESAQPGDSCQAFAPRAAESDARSASN